MHGRRRVCFDTNDLDGIATATAFSPKQNVVTTTYRITLTQLLCNIKICRTRLVLRNWLTLLASVSASNARGGLAQAYLLSIDNCITVPQELVLVRITSLCNVAFWADYPCIQLSLLILVELNTDPASTRLR